MLKADTIYALCPRAERWIVDALLRYPKLFEKFEVNTPLRMAHFLAQTAVESAYFTKVEENLSYTAKRITQVWPTRFNLVTAAAYANKPQKLANKVYGGRMGNTQPNDGWKYRGMGLIMLTGRDCYAQVGKIAGFDLLSNPEAAKLADGLLLCALAYWKWKGLNKLADKDDVAALTLRVNGGYHGLVERKALTARAKELLGHEDEPATSAALKFGDRGERVRSVQTTLKNLGYGVGKVDGVFGNGTRNAVLAFQADNGLDTTGTVTEEVWAAFDTAPDRPIAPERATATLADLDGESAVISTAATGAKATAAIGGTYGIASVSDITDKVDQFSMFRDVAEQAQGLFSWALSHSWVFVVGLALVALYGFYTISKSRLEDHRTGMNMRI